MKLYLIGSLRNLAIPHYALRLRDDGHIVFDDWFSAGPEADDKWRDHEIVRGRSYSEALEGYHAGQVFNFDLKYLKWCEGAVLILPAGRSAHLELGWALGKGKKGYVVLEGAGAPRWDIMYKFADGVYTSFDQLRVELKNRI